MKDDRSKIIQIMPSPPGLTAVFADQHDRSSVHESPIVCFGLVECSPLDGSDTFTYVEPMDITNDGFIEPVKGMANFFCIRKPGDALPTKGELLEYWEKHDKRVVKRGGKP